ncbi:MAG TPA: hypothetical protein VMV50_03130 [Candidatus Paceibacterota bacterium]|nr:hypothetical protein [Candidatus Paceibacterota bacterium]
MHITLFKGLDPYVIEHQPTGKSHRYQFWKCCKEEKKGNGEAPAETPSQMPKPVPLPARSWVTPVVAPEQSSRKREGAACGKTHEEAQTAFLAEHYPGGIVASQAVDDEIPDDLKRIPFRIEYRGSWRKIVGKSIDKVAHLVLVRLLQAHACWYDDFPHGQSNNFTGLASTVKGSCAHGIAAEGRKAASQIGLHRSPLEPAGCRW